MKLEFFTLCEGAFNSNGRVTIVNTYDILKSATVPCSLNLGVAIKLSFDKEEAGKHKITLPIISEETKSLVGRLESAFTLPEAEDVGYLNMVANVQNMTFPTYGWYQLQVEIDDETLGVLRIKMKNE